MSTAVPDRVEQRLVGEVVRPPGGRGKLSRRSPATSRRRRTLLFFTRSFHSSRAPPRAPAGSTSSDVRIDAMDALSQRLRTSRRGDDDGVPRHERAHGAIVRILRSEANLDLPGGEVGAQVDRLGRVLEVEVRAVAGVVEVDDLPGHRRWDVQHFVRASPLNAPPITFRMRCARAGVRAFISRASVCRRPLFVSLYAESTEPARERAPGYVLGDASRAIVGGAPVASVDSGGGRTRCDDGPRFRPRC